MCPAVEKAQRLSTLQYGMRMYTTSKNLENVHIPEALGFKADGSIHWSAVKLNKKCLECWWNKSREEIDKAEIVTGIGN